MVRAYDMHRLPEAEDTDTTHQHHTSKNQEFRIALQYKQGSDCKSNQENKTEDGQKLTWHQVINRND